MTFPELISHIEEQCQTLVWWSPDQIARGENVLNDPKKGERVWAIPRTTAQFLHDLVIKHQPQTILELGTSIGYSTVWLADAARAYGGHVHTVEIRNYKYDIARENIRLGGLEKFVSMYNASIAEMIERLDLHLGGQKIGLLFLDADRGHYHEYFPILEPHLSPDVIIVADNAITHRARMQPFIDMLYTKGWHIEISEIDNGVLVAHW